MSNTTKVNSSWVKKLTYDAKKRRLAVQTKFGAVYIYDKVAASTYTRLINAASVGSATSDFMQGKEATAKFNV